MNADPPITPRVTGRLPEGEAASADRIGRVAAGDLPAASPLDLRGMAVVTSCVTARFGLPDLVAEAAAAGRVAQVAVAFREPFAVLDGTPVRQAALLTPAELDEFRRLVDGASFLMPDGRLRAFLHMVVVAVPGEPTAGTREDFWVQRQLLRLIAATDPGATLSPGLFDATDPPPVVVWTVGLEADGGRGVRLQSGFRASLDRPHR